MRPELIFENEDIVVVNKPSGMLAIPDRHDAEKPSVLTFLRSRMSDVIPVHRIDRDTSGCICFAKNAGAHAFMNQLFEERKVEKTYHAIVHGTPNPLKGRIEAALMEHPVKKGKMIVNRTKGKQAITEYQVMESFGKFSYVECHLITGRTHQIRVHLSDMGCPIVCDPMYGQPNPVYVSQLKKDYHLAKHLLDETPLLQRLSLHAYQLSFTNNHGEHISVEAPLPKDMKAMLQQCRKWLRA